MFPGNICLMAALEAEIKPLLPRFRKISDRRPRLYELESEGGKIRLVISGAGNRNAAEAAAWVAGQKPEQVIGLGYAGGLSPALSLGEFFLPDRIRNLQGKELPCRGPWPMRGTLLTVNRVVSRAEEKKKLRSLADAVDMESFPVAEAMVRCGIPFAAIRGICDTLEEDLPLDFTELLESRGNLVLKGLALLLKNPGKIPAVLKLASRSRKIARDLSRFALPLLDGGCGR